MKGDVGEMAMGAKGGENDTRWAEMTWNNDVLATENVTVWEYAGKEQQQLMVNGQTNVIHSMWR